MEVEHNVDSGAIPHTYLVRLPSCNVSLAIWLSIQVHAIKIEVKDEVHKQYSTG